MAIDDDSTDGTKAPAPRRRRAKSPTAGVADSAPAGLDAAPTGLAMPLTVAEDGAAIAADRVDVTFGAVGRVETGQLDVDRGAVGAARAERLSLDRSAIGAAVAGEVDIRQSVARSILAREVRVDQSAIQTIVAQDVRIERSSFVGVLLARRVVGEVRVLLDWRGALAFGAAAGLVMRLFGRGRRPRG